MKAAEESGKIHVCGRVPVDTEREKVREGGEG